jgi:hypothetical protein
MRRSRSNAADVIRQPTVSRTRSTAAPPRARPSVAWIRSSAMRVVTATSGRLASKLSCPATRGSLDLAEIAVPTQIDHAARNGVKSSSALAVRHADESCAAFAAFDRSLRRAAAAEGFDLVPASLPEL